MEQHNNNVNSNSTINVQDAITSIIGNRTPSDSDMSTTTTSRKRFTEMEKEAIFEVFSEINKKDLRLVALELHGLGDRSYRAMGNCYSRMLKEKGLKSTSPRSRYTDEEREAIMRIFTEVDNAKERKAVIALMPCFEGRSYSSLYQQFSIMTRVPTPPTSPTESPTSASAKRTHSDMVSDAASDGVSEVTTVDFPKRQRVDGYDSDGNDPLEMPGMEDDQDNGLELTNSDMAEMFNNEPPAIEELPPALPTTLPVLPPSHMTNGDGDYIGGDSLAWDFDEPEPILTY